MKVFIASAANLEISDSYLKLAKDVSTIFAKNNFDLLFGAANYSMMGECYKTFIEYNRKVYAYTVPKWEKDFKKLKRAKCVRVEDTLLRFKKLYFKSDFIIILPGGIGTAAELFSSLEEYRSSNSNKVIILVNYNNYYEELIKWIESGIRKGFIAKDLFNSFKIVTNTKEIEKIVNDYFEG